MSSNILYESCLSLSTPTLLVEWLSMYSPEITSRSRENQAKGLVIVDFHEMLLRKIGESQIVLNKQPVAQYRTRTCASPD